MECKKAYIWDVVKQNLFLTTWAERYQRVSQENKDLFERNMPGKLFGGFLITLTYIVIMMIFLWRGGYLNKTEL